MSGKREICLALDTALEACSVGLTLRQNDEVQRVRRSLSLGRGHAEYLMDELSALLREADLSYQDLTRLAVTVGPGSFTGLRVGLATARALSLALHIPLIGASTLMALALTAQREGYDGVLGVAIDARRNQIYGQIFELSNHLSGPSPMCEAQALSAEVFSQHCVTRGVSALAGSGSNLLEFGPSRLPILDITCPDMGDLSDWALDQAKPDLPPAPLYLRAPDAKPQASKAIARR